MPQESTYTNTTLDPAAQAAAAAAANGTGRRLLDPYNLYVLGQGAKAVAGPLVKAAPALVGEIGGQLAWSTRKNREQLKRSYDDMMNGRLGLTNTQKTAMAGQANQQIQAGLAPQRDQLARAGAAMGPGGAGAIADQEAAQANAAALGQAQAQQGIEALSNQQALSKEAQIKAQLAQQSQIAKEDWRRVGGILAGSYGAQQPAPSTGFISDAYSHAMAQAGS